MLEEGKGSGQPKKKRSGFKSSSDVRGVRLRVSKNVKAHNLLLRPVKKQTQTLRCYGKNKESDSLTQSIWH